MGTSREGCEGRQRAGGALEEWVLVTQGEMDMGLGKRVLHSSILSTNAVFTEHLLWVRHCMGKLRMALDSVRDLQSFEYGND